MAENEEQREHEASARRLEELRESGQTLRSRDLSSGMILTAALVTLLFMSETISSHFKANFHEAFTKINLVATNPDNLNIIVHHLFSSSAYLLLPLLILLFFISFTSSFLLGGWNFSFKALKFNFEKLDPVKNLSNIFSKRMFVEVGKSCVKFLIITGCFYYFVRKNSSDILSLPYLQYEAALGELFTLMNRFIIILFTGVIVIIAIDVATSYFSYQKRTKMTNHELKDEQKNTEGNADVKRRMKSLQYALMKQKIPQMLPKADVVITNPTHYAVALRYRDNIDKAPIVLAKGKGNVAAYMRRLAVTCGVPIYEEPPLARAIFHTTKTGGMINPALYMAVAMVLTYINQLRQFQAGRGPTPVRAASLEIPSHFQFND